MKVMVGNSVGSSNQGKKNRCLWELQKPIALYDGFDL